MKYIFNKELLIILVAREGNKTRARIAKGIGVSPGELANWIDGNNIPRRIHLAGLAKYFKINVNEFFKSADTDRYNNYLLEKYKTEYLFND